MNLHPIFVHFPVAFFSIYAIAECLRFGFLMRQPYWFYVKAVLVIVGSASSAVTILTGLFFSEATTNKQAFEPLVSQHEFFAFTTAIIFFIIALAYAVAWVNKDSANLARAKFFRFLTPFSNFVLLPSCSIFLAILGLVCVTITGGIGGIMAFGPDADPFFGFVYRMFFK